MLSYLKKNWIFISVIAIYCCAIGIDTLDEDASQYASMSMEMMQTKNFLKVYEVGIDYLDKPPFLFWINSLSMLIFGINNFAFKLPSILFAIVAIIATYQLSKIYYQEKIAWLSAIILATCQATFLITNDIRTDTILMGCVIFSLWQLAKWVTTNTNKYFLFASVAIGLGMLTKGPIALFIPLFAFATHWLLQRNFTYFFKPIYLVGIAIIAVVLLPMSIGLYQQFDAHPEKLVNDATDVSGLKFFYWTQSFGRITGESVWNNGATFSFLLENLLWGMLPWTIIFLASLVVDWSNIFKNKFKLNASQEAITTGGFTLTYCSLAISKYQLPHYIYVVLPLVAIITAKFCYTIFYNTTKTFTKKIFSVLQIITITILILAPIVVAYYAFPQLINIAYSIAIVTIIAIIVLLKKAKHTIVYASVVAILGVNFFLNVFFYPLLLQYQAGNVIGRYIKTHHINSKQFYFYKYHGSSRNIHFYANAVIHSIHQPAEIKSGNVLLTMQEGLNELTNKHTPFQLLYTGQDFHVAMLTAEFLNIKTRSTQTTKYYLLKLL